MCHEQVGPQRVWTLEEIHFARSITNFVALALESLERGRIESALRESEERTRLIVDNALDAVITMDIAGNIVRTQAISQSSMQLDLGNLPNGSYLLQLETAAGISHQKIQVRH